MNFTGDDVGSDGGEDGGKGDATTCGRKGLASGDGTVASTRLVESTPRLADSAVGRNWEVISCRGIFFSLTVVFFPLEATFPFVDVFPTVEGPKTVERRRCVRVSVVSFPMFSFSSSCETPVPFLCFLEAPDFGATTPEFAADHCVRFMFRVLGILFKQSVEVCVLYKMWVYIQEIAERSYGSQVVVEVELALPKLIYLTVGTILETRPVM